MKIWLISDTHTEHEGLHIPADVDAVMHCGDESNHRDADWNEPESRSFFEWFSNLDIATKVFVPGNHSIAVELGLVSGEEYPNVQFLIHEAWSWNGLKIFGSPYTPWFFSWAYNVARSDLDAYWAAIPDDVDILLTHGPPKGILDVTRDWRSKQPIHVGSLSLTRQVRDRIQPRIHAFGHLHDEEGIRNFGLLTREATQYVNCACCNLRGDLVNHGQIIEI